MKTIKIVPKKRWIVINKKGEILGKVTNDANEGCLWLGGDNWQPSYFSSYKEARKELLHTRETKREYTKHLRIRAIEVDEE